MLQSNMIKGEVKMEWKNIYRGMIMGATDVIPGVSGGTIAVILGIYDRLIAAISGLFTREWKKHMLFLIPLVVGMGSAIFLFSHAMNWLLANYERPTFYFFLGLIIGILPFLFRESKAKTMFRPYHYVLLLIGITIIVLMPAEMGDGTVIEERSLAIYGLLFVSGIAASAAMILPGISGSFIFLVLGVYHTVIYSVSILDVKVLLPVAIGIVIGIVLMSKIIHYFLTHHHTATFALIIGLVIGSIYVVFPGWAGSVMELFACVIVFAGGLFAAYVLGKVEH